eukprot:1625232-Pyramimonas_sp.AAC.1
MKPATTISSRPWPLGQGTQEAHGTKERLPCCTSSETCGRQGIQQRQAESMALHTLACTGWTEFYATRKRQKDPRHSTDEFREKQTEISFRGTSGRCRTPPAGRRLAAAAAQKGAERQTNKRGSKHRDNRSSSILDASAR